LGTFKFLRSALGLAAIGVFAAPLAAFAAGDPESGKIIFEECAGCHAFNKNGIGPKLCGIMNRKAGSVPDYKDYSEVLVASEIIWTEKTLSEFIASPMDYVPETYMEYIGLEDPATRDDLAAYIKKMSTDPKLCPK